MVSFKQLLLELALLQLKTTKLSTEALYNLIKVFLNLKTNVSAHRKKKIQNQESNKTTLKITYIYIDDKLIFVERTYMWRNKAGY